MLPDGLKQICLKNEYIAQPECGAKNAQTSGKVMPPL